VLKIIIALFGVLICLGGLTILILPEKFKNIMNRWTGQPRFLFAVIIRVVLGAILLSEAANLKFPLAMKIIGAISILAAVVLLLVGQERMDRFIDWWMKQSENVFRAASVFALAFGAFLIYVTT
jgi:amino acid permease